MVVVLLLVAAILAGIDAVRLRSLVAAAVALIALALAWPTLAALH